MINTDMCGGCGECVRACGPDCIEMIWAFATLTRPEDCTSCGDCEGVCRRDVIRMDWVELSTDRRTGRWRDVGLEGLGASA
ncbi:MAG: ATP-binding protein [Planctomycetota bacterium]